MNKQDLLDRRSKLMFDAHAIMSGENVTTEQRTAVDKMLADANTLKADIERMVQLEAAEAELRSVPGRVPQGAPDASATTDNRSYAERRKATDRALRQAIKGEKFETRELTITSDGGFMIPVGVTDPKVAQKSAGSVYDLVYKFRSTSGETLKVPLWNDLANGFILSSAYNPSNSADPGVNGVQIAIDDVQTLPIQVLNSLINDVEFDLLGLIEKSIQSRYLRTAAQWITNGNGSNVGALATGYTGITTTTAGALKYGDLTAALASLDPAYYPNAAWLMSPATLANTILNITDSNNRPLFLPFGDGGISGFAGTIFGYPVKLNPYQPAVAAGNVAVQFGDFASGYTFREVMPGIVIKKSTDRYIELNALGVFAFARVGGAVTNPGTVTADTTQPVVSITID